MKHMDLKQMELDTAAAKVDELTKQLESLWSDSPAPPGSQAGAPPRVSLLVTPPPQSPKPASLRPEFRQGCSTEVCKWCAIEGNSKEGTRWKWTSNGTLGRKGAFF